MCACPTGEKVVVANTAENADGRACGEEVIQLSPPQHHRRRHRRHTQKFYRYEEYERARVYEKSPDAKVDGFVEQ